MYLVIAERFYLLHHQNGQQRVMRAMHHHSVLVAQSLESG
jgi:hypothetical protein